MNSNIHELKKKQILVGSLPFIVLVLFVVLWGLVGFVDSYNGISSDTGGLFGIIQTITSRLVPFLVGLCVIAIVPSIFASLYFRRRQQQEAYNVYDIRSGLGENSVIPEEIKD